MLLSKTFDIVMAVFDVGSHVVTQKVTFFHVFDTFLYRLAKAGFPKCPRTAFG